MTVVFAVTLDEVASKQAYLLFYKRVDSLSQQQERAALLRQASLREVSPNPNPNRPSAHHLHLVLGSMVLCS